MEKITGGGNLSILSYLGDFFGCGYLRIIYPSLILNQFRHNNFTFNSCFLPHFVLDPNFYNNISIVQFQRSATKNQYDSFKYFKHNIRNKCKVAFYYEIDDLLFGINKWNYAHEFFDGKEDIIKEMLNIVDGVIVSTEKLKKIYSEYNPNISISKNRLPKFIWGEPSFKINNNKKIRIFWGGSANHFATPQLIKKGIRGGDFGKQLINFIKTTIDEFQWILIGGFPQELNDVKDKIEYHNWVSINNYPNYIKSLNIDIGIAPLEKNLFNSSKSNIKALEYTAAGFPGIYTNIDPYKNLSLTSDTEKEMIEQILMLAKDFEMRKIFYEKDLNILRGELFWEENNNILKYINGFLNLMGKEIG